MVILAYFSLAAHGQFVAPVSSASASSASAWGGSFLPVFSHDGRFVVFLSHANNLVTNDHSDRALDVFVSDVFTGSTELISVNAADVGGGDADSTHISVSRYALGVAFSSRSSNLVTRDTNNAADVFLRDRTSGLFRRTELISADRFGRSPSDPVAFAGRPLSSNPQIEAFGSRIVFDSVATNLTAIADTNDASDVFFAGQSVSVAHGGGSTADGASHSPQVSENGQYIAFISTATNLVLNGYTNRGGDIYVRDVAGGGFTYWASPNARNLIVLSAPAPGAPGSSYACFNYALSGHGRAVVYQAAFLAPYSSSNTLLYCDVGFTNSIRIAADSDLVGRPQISSQGDWVAFSSRSNVYLWNRATGSNILVSANTNGFPANGPSHSPVMDRSGNYVAFLSRASDLVPNSASNRFQIYLYDRGSAITRLLSINTNGAASAGDFELSNLAITSEGPLMVAFDSTASDLVANDFNGQSDVFVRDISRSQTKLISRAHSSRPARTLPAMSGAPGSISADGRIVAFASFDNAFVANDTNLWQDVFVRDLESGALQRLSGQPVRDRSSQAALTAFVSAGGNHVVYGVWGGPAGGGTYVLFWRDLSTSTNVEIPRSSPSFDVLKAAISPDGSLVVVQSAADILARNMSTGQTNLVSVNYAGTGGGNAPCTNFVLSPDARWVTFESTSTNLTTNNTYGFKNLFVRDLRSNVTEIASIGPNGSTQWGSVSGGAFSGDSRFVAFVGGNYPIIRRDLLLKTSEHVASGDHPALNWDGRFIAYEAPLFQGPRQIHVKDMNTGVSRLVSATPSGVPGNGHSTEPIITPSGRFIIFESLANDIVANDNNNAADIFIADRFLRTVLLLTINTAGTASANGQSSKPVLSADGRKLVFQSLASDLINGDYNDRRDVFVATLSLPDSDGDGMDDDYEVTYFGDLSRDGSGDFDSDGQTDYSEFIAGTDPRDDASILRVISISAPGSTARQLVWSSVVGREYAVQYKDSLTTDWSLLAGTVRASSMTATKLDTTAAAAHRFYRVIIAE